MTEKLIIDRVKGFQAFKKIFDKRLAYSRKEAIASFEYKSSDEALNSVKIGVSVPKKKAKRANVRNRIKRLLREALRFELQKKFTVDGLMPIASIIITWREPPIKASLIGLADVLPFVEQAVEFAYKKYYAKKTFESGANSSDKII